MLKGRGRVILGTSLAVHVPSFVRVFGRVLGAVLREAFEQCFRRVFWRALHFARWNLYMFYSGLERSGCVGLKV